MVVVIIIIATTMWDGVMAGILTGLAFVQKGIVSEKTIQDGIHPHIGVHSKQPLPCQETPFQAVIQLLRQRGRPGVVFLMAE